jgi:carboxymethylenebutenolidase
MPEPPLLSPEGVPGAVLDASALHVEELTFLGAHGDPVGGYLARPAPPGSHPGIVVIHEAGGLGEHIRDVTRRIANQGYVALGVDLYTREGGPPPAGNLEAIMARLFAMPDARVLADLEGAADRLRARNDATGKVGCIGFCMGGRAALLFACASSRLDAAVDCWGGFIDTATPRERSTPERPTPPLEMVPRLHCPLMAAIGAEDRNPSPAVGLQLRERLRQAPFETSVDIYEGAGHAFFADHRPTYRPAPAARLWERVVPFLERHLR